LRQPQRKVVAAAATDDRMTCTHHEEPAMQSLHDLEATSITGEPIRLSEFEGQLCLIVNVASR
jgi:hypothetical protein